MNRKEILNKNAWIRNSEKLMIVGHDIDAIMSACFMHHYLEWRIIGFYNLEYIYLDDRYDLFFNKNDIVFVDLDICRNDFKSIGHHILQINLKDDPTIIGHSQTINPNLITNTTMSNFKAKYPLGTIHFLLWLYDWHIADNDLSKYLIWIPDSSWINGQAHRYRENVKNWIKIMKVTVLDKMLDIINTKQFEHSIKEDIFTNLEKCGFKEGKGQVRSQYLGLRGFQCQFKHPRDHFENINKLIRFICEVFKWKNPNIPEKYKEFKGLRVFGKKINEIITKGDGLSSFINSNNIFSYAIPNRGKINYTIFKQF